MDLADIAHALAHELNQGPGITKVLQTRSYTGYLLRHNNLQRSPDDHWGVLIADLMPSEIHIRGPKGWYQAGYEDPDLLDRLHAAITATHTAYQSDGPPP